MTTIPIPINSSDINTKLDYSVNGQIIKYNYVGVKDIFIQYKTLLNVPSTIINTKYFVNPVGTDLEHYSEYIEFETTQNEFDSLKVTMAPVKYNKNGIFNLIFTEGDMAHYNKYFCEVHGLIVSTDNADESVSTITGVNGVDFITTDGCGNNVYPTATFGVDETAIIANVGNKLQDWQMKRMVNFGDEISLRSFDATALENDINKINEKFTTVSDVYYNKFGFKPLGAISPNNSFYENAWMLINNNVLLMNNSGSNLNNVNNINLSKFRYTKTDIDGKVLDQIKTNFETLVTSTAKAAPLVLSFGIKNNISVIKPFLEYLKLNYGSNGSDDILFSSIEEVYEYEYIKRSIRFKKEYNSLSGITRITMSGYVPVNFRRREITLLINKNTLSSLACSNGIYTLSSATKSPIMSQVNLSFSVNKINRLTDISNLINNGSSVNYNHDVSVFYLALTNEKRQLFPQFDSQFLYPILNSVNVLSLFGLDMTFQINSIGTNLTYINIKNDIGETTQLPYVQNGIYNYTFNHFSGNTIDFTLVSPLGNSNIITNNIMVVLPPTPLITNIISGTQIDNIINFSITTTGYTTMYEIVEAPLNTDVNTYTPTFSGNTDLLVSNNLSYTFNSYGNNLLYIRVSNKYELSNVMYLQILTEPSPSPTLNSISVSGLTNGVIKDPNITLLIDANYAIDIKLSTNSNFTNAIWEQYNTSVKFVLPNVGGTYTIYYALRNSTNTIYGSLTCVYELPPIKLLINFNGNLQGSSWNNSYSCTDINPTTSSLPIYYNGVSIGTLTNTRNLSQSTQTTMGYSTGNNSGVYPDYLMNTNIIGVNINGNEVNTMGITFTDNRFINKLLNVKIFASTISTSPNVDTVKYYIGNVELKPTKIINNYSEVLTFYSVEQTLNKININYVCSQDFKLLLWNLVEVDVVGDVPTINTNTITVGGVPLLINGETISL